MEMPLRLIGPFDQRWRDTPVKNQQPPVPPLSLCISLFLYPSFFLSIPLSLYLLILYLFLPCSLFPTFSLSFLPLFKTLCLSFSCKCKYTHTRLRGAVLFFQHALAHSSSPGGYSVMPTGDGGTGQMAHSAP